MNGRLALKQIICLAFLLLLIPGCKGSTPEPTIAPTVEIDLQPTIAPTIEEEATEAPPTEPEPTIEPTLTATPEISTEFSDEYITVNLDEVEKTDIPPEDIDMDPASEGHTYIVVQLTITRIESVHLVNALGFGQERPVLGDASGQEYRASFGQFKGVRFSDPTDITSSAEFVEGAEGILIFETPLESEPENLTFIYAYQENLDEGTPIRGEILITF